MISAAFYIKTLLFDLVKGLLSLKLLTDSNRDTEARLCAELRSVLAKYPNVSVDIFISSLNIRLCGAKPADCIKLYFKCQSSADLVHMRRLDETGDLLLMIEVWLQQFVSQCQMRVKAIYLINHMDCLQYLSESFCFNV